MKREKELALTLAVRLVEQDKSITSSTKKANASVEVAKILEQYLKESTPECYKNPYEQVFMGGDNAVEWSETYTTAPAAPKADAQKEHHPCKACGCGDY